MERKAWTITILQENNLFYAECSSPEGKTINSSFYKTEEAATEAGCLIVDRAWESENVIKRKVNLDIDWLILAASDEITLYIDLQTGELLPHSNYNDTDLDPEELELSDRYLQIPDFSNGSRDMEEFIESVKDITLRLELEDAFYKGGKGRFRRVKNIAGDEWESFEKELIIKRLMKWLESKNIELITENEFNPAQVEDSNSILNNNQKQEIIAESTAVDKLVDSIDNFDPEEIQDARKKITTSITLRQGQPQFRQQLLVAYNSRCAISEIDVEQALEAAHIFPYLGSETNHPSNGLLLRADLHTLFDLNLITIDPEEMAVLIAPSLDGTYYEEFKGKKIHIPENQTYAPSRKALRNHYEQCEWLKQVISKCVAVVWRSTNDGIVEYCPVFFWPVQLVGYESVYWWKDECVGCQSPDFENVKKQSIKIAEDHKLPLLWGVGHMVKARERACAVAGDKPMQPENGFISAVYGFYPVDEQGNQLEFKFQKELKNELSLTSKQIKQLGEPDMISRSKNPPSEPGAPMKLYLADRAKREFTDSV